MSFTLQANPLKEEFIFHKEGLAVAKIFQKEAEMIKRLAEDPSMQASGDLQKQLGRQCLMFEAREGREPNLSETLLMKQTIDQAAKDLTSLPKQKFSEGFVEFVKQQSYTSLCEKSLEKGSIERQEADLFEKELHRFAKEMKIAQERQKEIMQAMDKQQQENQIDRSPSLGR